MKITITINTDNGAFHGDGLPDASLADEVGRILRDLAYNIELDCGIHEAKILDINGNACGELKVRS
ncbi:MAG: hypothetical protein AB7F40_04430 [Victivallaceae bacterium]